jgi:hypothetical protein
MHFSPKYQLDSMYSFPSPTSIVGNTATWNVGLLSDSGFSLRSIYFTLYDNPITGLLTADDTVHTDVAISPVTGDANTTNNYAIVVDTVNASHDPNEIWVSPQGLIPAGTQLKYTIAFENTGNDTAFNIYVMDTLSDFFDMSSLRMVFSSHKMSVTKIYDEICHNIVRFDFLNINLLDSSHHGKCDGSLQFTINTYSGLSNGSEILNQAGIYFDNNSVVMTNTVEDIIGVPTIVPSPIHNKKGEIADVQLFPNPTTNELTIKSEPNLFSSFTISNSMGQVLVDQNIGGAVTKADVGALAPGLYYVTLKGGEGVAIRKFVKM